MSVHLSLVLFLGCLVVLWLRRYIAKLRLSSRQIPSVRSSINWEFTHRFLPVPQCDLKIDDTPFLNRVSSWISGIGKYEQDNPLLDVRIHGRNRRSSAREMRSGFLPRLSIFCYYYISPTLAIVGILCAVSLLAYQAGWTAVAISSRIQDGVGHSNITRGSSVTAPLLRRGFFDIEARGIDSNTLPDTILTSIEIERSISAEPFTDAVEVPAPYRYDVRDNTGSVLQPLIPGITVPLSHAFALLLALLLSQVIHEAGHLVVAALHNIPPIRIVIGVWAVFPVAAVALPSSVNQLSPKSLLRIAAAGPYHNLLTYFTVLMLPLTGIQHLFYQDVASQGVYITQINDASSLKPHLPERVIVHQIDDVPLGTFSQKTVPSISPTDMWTAYLLRDHQDVIDADFTSKLDKMDVNRGWCVTEDTWKDSAKPPCPPATGIRFGIVGQSLNLARRLNESNDGDAAEHRCFAAYPLLTAPTVDCASVCTVSTSTKNMCIRPISEERILRIHYEADEELIRQQGATENKQVLLYAGDPETVFSDVRVESLKPRGGKAFQWVLAWGDILIMYIATLSLALATLNLLPLPRLDGTHILSALLSLIFGSSDNERRDDEYDRLEAEDVELDTTTASFREPVLSHGKKRRWHQFITWTTSGLAIICMGGGIILGLL